MGLPRKDKPFTCYFEQLLGRYMAMSGLDDAMKVLDGLGKIGRSWGCNGELCAAILNEYLLKAERNYQSPHDVLSYSLFNVSSGKIKARNPEEVLAIYTKSIQTRSS